MSTIGVVLSSFRYGHLAGHCIETVLGQSRQADRIWLVDDGVGDCKHLPPIYPEVDFVLREENLGVRANFQDMLSRVDTDYVMFVGADNWLRADAIWQLQEQLPADIVVCDIIATGTQPQFKAWRDMNPGDDYQGGMYWSRADGWHGSMLYNVKLAKDVGGYCDQRGSAHSQHPCEDMLLYNRMVSHGAVRRHVGHGLLYYRKHRENFNK